MVKIDIMANAVTYRTAMEVSKDEHFDEIYQKRFRKYCLLLAKVENLLSVFIHFIFDLCFICKFIKRLWNLLCICETENFACGHLTMMFC